MRRLLPFAGVLALTGVLAAPSMSYAQQSVNFLLGGFVPKSEDARDRNDVLFSNLHAGVDSLLYNISDFNGATVGAEWLTALGDRAEAGLGIGLYSKRVPSVYRDFEDDFGNEIEQDLKLRIVPFTATVRFLPLGRRDAFTPYIGAGVAVLRWRYEETGDFIFGVDEIRPATYTDTGTAVGPLILGGARFPVGSVDIGGEIRYQNATGDLSEDVGFLGSEIDLTGFSYLVTLNVRF